MLLRVAEVICLFLKIDSPLRYHANMLRIATEPVFLEPNERSALVWVSQGEWYISAPPHGLSYALVHH